MTYCGCQSPELPSTGLRSTRWFARSFSADHRHDRLLVEADDSSIAADGSDATRVVFWAVDRYGAPRPYVTDSVTLALTGPALLVGDNPFDFAIGGVGAVWIRSLPGNTGKAVLTAGHPRLGRGTVTVRCA